MLTKADIESVIAVLNERFYLVPREKQAFKQKPEFIGLVAQFVCGYKGVDVESLKSTGHKREVSDMRRIIWHLIHKHSSGEISQREMGAYFNRDHATVLIGIRTCKEIMERDRFFKMNVENIERALLNHLPAK